MGMAMPDVLEYKVYCYTVCWRDCYSRSYEWKHKDFANKKEAQEFARSHRKDSKSTKPYIVQTIVSRFHFKEGINFEPVRDRKIIYWSYEKKIRY
jgi:hypothetical protein